MVVVTMILSFYFIAINKDTDFLNSLVVYTLHRTHNTKEINSYPIVNTFEKSPFSSHYFCMLDAQIARESGGLCSTQKTIGTYETCIRTRTAACEAQSDLTWPRDYGFLSCLQYRFNMTLHQTTLFLACMDSSPGPTVASLQSLNSPYFMGSYNYASLLLTAMTVLSSFVVLTAGGFYFTDNLSLDASWGNHISGNWTPFSWPLIVVGLIWNIVGLIGAIIVAFLADGVPNSYPVTLWTSIFTITIFVMSTCFFLVYFIEYASAGKWNWWHNSTPPAAAADSDMVTLPPPPPLPLPRPPSQSSGFQPGPQSGYESLTPDLVSVVQNSGGNSAVLPQYSGMASQFYNNYWARGNQKPYAYQPICSGRGAFYAAAPHLSHPFSHPFNRSHCAAKNSRLGMKVFDDSVAQFSKDSEQTYFMYPMLSLSSAWAFLFTDGALMLGVVSPMQSILTESAFFIFGGIVIARILQVVCVFFYTESFVRNHNLDPRSVLGYRGAHFFVWLSSIFFIGVSIFHFWRSNEFLNVSSDVHALSICFIFFVLVVPEFLYLVEMILGSFANEFYNVHIFRNYMVSWLFLYKYVIRAVFITAFLMVPSTIIKDQQANLNALSLSTAVSFLNQASA